MWPLISRGGGGKTLVAGPLKQIVASHKNCEHEEKIIKK